jgi:hypothetical protein
MVQATSTPEPDERREIRIAKASDFTEFIIGRAFARPVGSFPLAELLRASRSR